MTPRNRTLLIALLGSLAFAAGSSQAEPVRRGPPEYRGSAPDWTPAPHREPHRHGRHPHHHHPHDGPDGFIVIDAGPGYFYPPPIYYYDDYYYPPPPRYYYPPPSFSFGITLPLR